MLLNYSYDNANKVLTMFNEGKLATLSVYRSTSDIKSFVMDYTLITEHPLNQQTKIRKAMSNPNSYPVRTRVTELLNQFIENQITDSVISFSLSFTALDTFVCKSTSQCQFSGNSNCVTNKQIIECLDDLDGIFTRMGMNSIKANNMYKKEGSGRNKKTVPVTLSEVTKTIRQMLVEE